MNNPFIFANTIITKYSGGNDMTDKELLYIEDALGHEQYFQQKCKETAQSLTDPELKSCVETYADRHSTIFNRFYSLL
jgi:hypothetical protein